MLECMPMFYMPSSMYIKEEVLSKSGEVDRSIL
jgi:hypothetical protein